jgi:dipeptidyl aminopeptidase/acylaminoacyl peptidase
MPAFTAVWLSLLLGVLIGPAGPARDHRSDALPLVRAPRPPVPLADYFDIRRVRDASFSHDERHIAYRSDEDGRPDIWIQPVEGGAAQRITRVQGVIHAFAFSPARDVLLYEVDEGGNDATRLYLTDSRGAPAVEIFPELPKGSRAGFIQWAPDGASFLYITNLPGQSFTELHEYNIAAKQSTTIWRSPENLSFALASPDLRRFVLLEVLSDVNFNLYLLERGSGAPVLLTPHTGDVTYTPTGFSRDGERLYVVSDGGDEFSALHEMELQTRTMRVVQKRDWDIERGELSKARQYFVTVVNVDGAPEVEIRHAASGQIVELPRPPGGGTLVPVTFSPSDRYLAATLTGDTQPETLFVIDLRTGAARPVRDVLPPSLRSRSMIAGRAVRIPTFDDRRVPALLYRPAGPGPFPAVIDVHGGPNAQARRAFSGLRQYLVSKGVAVLVPNVRGSTGYGRTYASLDNLDLGGGPLKDVIACKRWLVEHADVDERRVAIMGASYGGYMALAAAAFAPAEFAAHVDYFGISDLKSYVAALPPYWMVYSPYTFKKYGNPKDSAHAKYQHERSPINYVERIERPLLVVQGENDALVRREQSDRLVEALRARNRPVYYLVLPGEGHGFSRNESRLKAYDATDRFFDRFLFGDRTVGIFEP